MGHVVYCVTYECTSIGLNEDIGKSHVILLLRDDWLSNRMVKVSKSEYKIESWSEKKRFGGVVFNMYVTIVQKNLLRKLRTSVISQNPQPLSEVDLISKALDFTMATMPGQVFIVSRINSTAWTHLTKNIWSSKA